MRRSKRVKHLLNHSKNTPQKHANKTIKHVQTTQNNIINPKQITPKNPKCNPKQRLNQKQSPNQTPQDTPQTQKNFQRTILYKP
jgi:hypothetical protein